MALQQLAGSANPETVFNENMDALMPAALFGRRHPVTTGLTWGYYGGSWGGLSVADGTVSLTNGTDNYLVVNRATGAVSAATSTTNWNDYGTYARLHKVTTSGSVITAVVDHRAGLHGALGPMVPPAVTTVASASTIALPIGARVVKISGTTGISTITATGHNGAAITLVFLDALTVTDGSNLKLAGNFTTTADDTLTLVCDGTNWYETCRSVN